MNLAVAQQGTLTQIYGATPLVHFTNSGDATSGDPKTYDKLLGIMGGRLQLHLRSGDHIVYPEEVVAHQRALAAYHRAADLSELPDDHVVGIPGSVRRSLSANYSDLSPADRALLRDITEPVRRQGGVLLPYIASPGSECVARELGLAQDAMGRVGLNLNNKWYVKNGIQRLNDRAGRTLISTPYGRGVKNHDHAVRVFRDLLAIAKSDSRSDGRVWVLVNCSGGGKGLKAVRTERELEAWLAKPHVRAALAKQGIEGGVHMDVGIKPRAKDFSPSANLFVGHTRAEDLHLVSSYQLFAEDGKEWIGNIGPVSPEDKAKIRQVLPHIFDWIRSQGGFGFCGVDFIFGEDGTLYLIEINFRITGAMAAGFLARERGARAWIAANEISVPWGTTIAACASHLSGNGILLGPSSPTSGVFVLNVLPALGFGNDNPVVQGGILAASRDEGLDILSQARIEEESATSDSPTAAHAESSLGL